MNSEQVPQNSLVEQILSTMLESLSSSEAFDPDLVGKVTKLSRENKLSNENAVFEAIDPSQNKTQ